MPVDAKQDQALIGNMPVVQPRQSEASLIGRFVTILTPLFVVAAGWIAGLVARHVPGANLDQTQIVTFMTAAATAVLIIAWKWLQGWQQHEALVAQGKATARKPAAAPPPVVANAANSDSAQAAVYKLAEDVSGLMENIINVHARLDQLTRDLSDSRTSSDYPGIRSVTSPQSAVPHIRPATR